MEVELLPSVTLPSDSDTSMGSTPPRPNDFNHYLGDSVLPNSDDTLGGAPPLPLDIKGFPSSPFRDSDYPMDVDDLLGASPPADSDSSLGGTPPPPMNAADRFMAGSAMEVDRASLESPSTRGSTSPSQVTLLHVPELGRLKRVYRSAPMSQARRMKTPTMFLRRLRHVWPGHPVPRKKSILRIYPLHMRARQWPSVCVISPLPTHPRADDYNVDRSVYA